MIKFVYLDRHWQNIKQQYLKELNDMWSKGNVVYQIRANLGKLKKDIKV